MFSRRHPRMNRGRVSAGLSAAGFLPTSVGGGSLLLWLRADQGVTLSNASVNALTLWTSLNCTPTAGISDPLGGTNGVQIADTVDGGPVTHSFTGLVSNSAVGPSIFHIWVKQPTSDWVAFLPSPSTFVYYRYSTKTVGTISATVTVRYVQTVDGWDELFIYESTGTTGITAQVVMATGDGGNPYQGVGGRTVQLFQPITTQNRVSAWADQSGLGNNATQGTPANQPLLRSYDSGGNWIPSPGTGNDIGWPTDLSGKSLALPSSFYNLWDGDGVPFTVLVLNRRVGAITGNSDLIWWLLTAGGPASYPIRVQTANFVEYMSDGTLVINNFWTSVPSTNWESLAATYSGTALRFYKNASADASNPIAADLASVDMIAANIGLQNDVVHEMVVYKSVLSDSDRKHVENGMRARWGLPLL